MRLLHDKCDVFAIGIEVCLNRYILGECHIGFRIGWRCYGVIW